MNYDHAFHAGNFADIVKHAVLAAAVARMAERPGAFAVIDTHGGAGRHDLTGAAAQRTGEARAGALRLLQADGAPEALRPFLAALGPESGFPAQYPGSPLIALAGLRAQDRLVAVERNPRAAALLRDTLAGDRRAQAIADDGYRRLARLVPPPERRGLVLIDPAFEVADEFVQLARAVKDLHRRWEMGSVIAWYPQKQPAAAAALQGEVLTAGMREVHALHWRVRDDGTEGGLLAAGLLLVRPPFALLADIAAMMPWLMARLAQGPGAGFDFRRLDRA